MWTLGAYAGLLLLASTRFSVVSWMFGRWAWTWEYFQYSCRNGWGYQYQSDYSFAVVLTYLVAFVVGIVGYVIAGKRIAGGWSFLALILCVLGSISFFIEGTHWLWEHHLSWIAICPAASIALAALAIIQLAKRTDLAAGGYAPKDGRITPA